MSTLFAIPIVVLASYMIYRHIRREFAGKGSCCGCASGKECSKGASLPPTPDKSVE